ncbi:SRPBCC domain-containing protein [Algoriphagus sp. CAU 1675]|uniref:SRPBCC family protein n=1 Tax=Algoriphagus sp. CAU 1675 TaxID=3032597 RepID=UPI0023DC5F6F|nr:SRPBCC domain-containing protein [Algoriphagus sp. CAU 1675]MDF2158044.1 SRPBCC domain-containing protein [Algoriphagus sp. CAU 1675]
MSYSDLEISRNFSAPIEKTYAAFSNPEQLSQWWGPSGFEMEIKTFEFYPGGMVHFVLRGPNGFDIWAKWVIREIEEPSRLQVINSFSNPVGETVPAPEIPFGKDWPLEMVMNLEFYQDGDLTRIDLVSFPHQAPEASQKLFSENLSNMQQGFKGTFDALEKFLKG